MASVFSTAINNLCPATSLCGLTLSCHWEYAEKTAKTMAAGFGSPIYRRNSRRNSEVRLFCCVRMVPFMGGPCGEPQGSPVPVAGLPTRTDPPTPFGSGAGGFRHRYTGSQNMAKDAPWPKSIRKTKVDREYHEGVLYQLDGLVEDLIELGIVAWDSAGKLIGGPGVRNIVCHEDGTAQLEVLATYLADRDAAFQRVITKILNNLDGTAS